MRPAEQASPQQFGAIHDYLAHQRWFGAKGREFAVHEVHPLSWLDGPEARPAVRIELVTVVVDGDSAPEPHAYQLPLSYRDAPAEHLSHALVGSWDEPELGGTVWAYDALHDKEATPVWIAGLLRERAEPDLAFHLVGAPELDGDARSLVISAEQSNTSLVFGQTALLKVFRRIHHGRNPDIEIHEAFAGAGCDNVATLLGWVDAHWPDAEGVDHTGDLAMFSDFFRTGTDGWELAIGSVRDLYAEGDLHADEVGGDFAGESRRLGATTAAVHADLARLLPTGRWGRSELTSLASALRNRLDEAVAGVPELQPYADDLRAAYADVAALAEPAPVQRVHGDLHLGQTMRTVAGWRLIDFEGEPARSLRERGELDSPLRDVAGMLRSFDYAARHLLADHPHDEQLAYRAAEWSARNREAFCRGYAEVAGTDPRDHAVLLRAYETDKAAYEVLYESRTRPSWLPIPMAAVARLAGAQVDAQGTSQGTTP